MSPRALLTGDWHLASNARDEYRFKFVEETLPALIEEERVDLLIFLGDVCEVKDNHEAGLVNRIVQAFHELSRLCPGIAIQGNHDWLSSPDNPFFGFLSRLRGNGITWVKRPTPLAAVKNVPEALSRACKAVLLPHSADYERDWGDIDFRAYDWAFAHQSFSGARSESGFELGGVPLSYFPKNLRIVSGDIHAPQTWGPLTYAGSPYNVDFGDDIEPRVILWEGGELVSIPVPGPQKRLLELPKAGKLDGAGFKKGDILKVRVEVGSYDEWPARKAELEEWAERRGLVLHQALPLITGARPTARQDASEQVQSDEDVYRAYCKKLQLGDGYVKTGLKLL